MTETDADTKGLDAQFRLLVEAITDYAIFRIDPDGTVASWNSGAQRAKGYSASEIIGQNFSLFFTPEDRAAGKPAQALATARANKRFEDEGWRVRKDGTRFWASVVIARPGALALMLGTCQPDPFAPVRRCEGGTPRGMIGFFARKYLMLATPWRTPQSHHPRNATTPHSGSDSRLCARVTLRKALLSDGVVFRVKLDAHVTAFKHLCRSTADSTHSLGRRSLPNRTNKADSGWSITSSSQAHRCFPSPRSCRFHRPAPARL
jgi:PAS domain S-box-containing protein